MVQLCPFRKAAPPVVGALYVTAYGAVGDGETDDTAAIQECIDAAYTQSKNVFFPAGTYRVNILSQKDYSLLPVSGVKLFGAGVGSTIINFDTQISATDVFRFNNVDHAEIAELTVTTPDPGNLDTVASTSWYPCAFKFLGSDDCKLTNVRVEHMRQGIKVGSGTTCNRLTVSGYETHDCITAIFTSNLSVASFTGCTCQVITNNTIQNHTLYAERECHNVNFTNCAFSGAGGYVAHLYMEGAYTSSYFTFDNCSFIGPRYGVRLDSQFDHVTFTNGCVFQAGSSDGVFIVESCTNVLVEDFTATGTGYIVYNLAGSTPSNVVFKDGTWFGNALEVGGSREGVTYINVVEG